VRASRVLILAFVSGVMLACSPIPRPGSWHVLGPIPNLSFADQVVALSNGSALVFGEATAAPNTQPLPAAAVYEATTNTWRPIALPPIQVLEATLTALRDGTVLLAGGTLGPQTSAAAFLYQPGANQWVRTGDMVEARASHSATLLQDGRVLVVGGQRDGQSLASCEIYDPGSRTWTLVKPLPHTRVYQTSALMSDGRVMIAGGDLNPPAGGSENDIQPGTSPGTGAYTSAEIYDPRLDSWSELSEPTTIEDPSLLPLHDGELLFYGGHFGFQKSNLVYLYDPRSGLWLSKGTAMGGGVAIELTDGRILFPESLWTYDPSQDLWMPVTQVPTGIAFGSLPFLKPDGTVLVIAIDSSQQNAIALIFDAGGFPPLPGSSGPLADSRATSVLLVVTFVLMLLIGARYLMGSRKSTGA
jgi:Galactose oxidase, central domain